MIYGDSEKIPFENNYFDAITIAFGVRNFENLNTSLQEVYRVLKPKGIVVILETSIPENIFFKQLYNFYTKFILPKLGNFFSKKRLAYQYLSNSAMNFPYGKKFNNILSKIGFIKVDNYPQTIGVVSIYSGEKATK